MKRKHRCPVRRTKKSQGKIPSFKNNFYILNLIWKIAPGRVVLTFAVQLVSFASWTFYSVVFMRYLFGSDSGGRTFGEAIVFVWIVAAAGILQYLLEAWFYMRYTPLTDIRIHYAMNKMLFDKAVSVDVSSWADPEFYDDYTRATGEAMSRGLSVVWSMGEFVAAVLAAAFVIATMCDITWISIPFLLFPVLGQMVFYKRVWEKNFQCEQAQIPYKRRYDYVNRTVYLKQYAEEMRLTHMYDIMTDTYESAYKNIKKVIHQFSLVRMVNGVIGGILCYPLAFQGMWLCGAILVMVTKTLSLGDFVVLSSAIVSANWMLDDISQSFNKMYENGLFADNLKRFLNYQSKMDETAPGAEPTLPIQTIELKNVSFRYPGQSKYALQNISMTFESGKKYALVGLNGSGKTTLVSLIMRLYDPTEGAIYVNGIDIRTYDIQKYRSLIGTTLQDFSIFAATVLENVKMGALQTEAERAACMEALSQAGMLERVQKLQNGPDTILTREFDEDGAVLSGGENQKIAIARAFAGNAPIVILDEPSSALDPIAEHQVYETIARLCSQRDPSRGKISVIISHRLSSAALCDYIYVLQNGTLAEQGCHAQLYAAGGIYAELFTRQAKNYQEENTNA